MPPAARITDMHTCPKVEPGPVPHVGGPVLLGEPTVLVGFQPAARVGDTLTCVGPPDSVSQGEKSVLIGNKPAARMGDPTSHGGVIVAGCPTVIIGSSAQAETLKTDEPFCEECERKRKEREARQQRRG
ncbi:PAAR domain-containing protein [Sorangium sp. So ce1335]|uniref:PAAR domain-containing protein n=1 Tax=Sorangium sp. So ce1335 TaxID=3133335 RepID=UPI003F631A0C